MPTEIPTIVVLAALALAALVGACVAVFAIVLVAVVALKQVKAAADLDAPGLQLRGGLAITPASGDLELRLDGSPRSPQAHAAANDGAWDATLPPIAPRPLPDDPRGPSKAPRCRFCERVRGLARAAMVWQLPHDPAKGDVPPREGG